MRFWTRQHPRSRIGRAINVVGVINSPALRTHTHTRTSLERLTNRFIRRSFGPRFRSSRVSLSNCSTQHREIYQSSDYLNLWIKGKCREKSWQIRGFEYASWREWNKSNNSRELFFIYYYYYCYYYCSETDFHSRRPYFARNIVERVLADEEERRRKGRKTKEGERRREQGIRKIHTFSSYVGSRLFQSFCHLV